MEQNLSVADPFEVSRVKELLTLLAKRIKMLHLYPANSPILSGALDTLYGKLGEFLEEHGTLELAIGQFEISYKGEVVYVNMEKPQSLAFKLFYNGIRGLLFADGLEKGELASFLEALSADLEAREEDDLVTLLWEREFPHISYYVVEDPFDAEAINHSLSEGLSSGMGGGAGGGLGEGVGQGWGQGKGAGLGTGARSNSTPQAESAELLLEDSDVNQELIREAAQRDVYGRLLDIFIDILPDLTDRETLSRAMNKVGLILRWLLAQGSFKPCSEAVIVLREAVRGHLEARGLFEGELKGLARRDFLLEVKGKLEEDSEVPWEDISAFFRELGAEAIDGLCDIIPQLKGTKKVFRALVDLGRGDASPFLQRFKDPNLELVRVMVQIVGEIGDPSALAYFRIPLSNPDPQVRREAALALARFPTVMAAPYLITALRDDDYQTRVAALEVIERSGLERFAPTLEEVISQKDFGDKPPAEKRRIFRAYGRINSNRALPLLEKVLGGKGWLGRARQDEIRACAVAALEAIGTPEAIALMERYQASGPKPLREACATSLARLRAQARS